MTVRAGPASSIDMKLVVVAALLASTTAQAEEAHRVTRIRAVLPFSGISTYRGDLGDGMGVPLLGITASHERGALVFDAGVRGDFVQVGLGRTVDVRVGARTALGGPVDLVGLAGLRWMSYEPGGDGYAGKESVVAATTAGALEFSKQRGFTLRVIVTASKKIAREVDNGAVKGGAVGMEYGFEGGVELGAAL